MNTTLQKRLSNFVDWIKPASNTREDIKERAKGIKKNIKQKAEDDGVIVMKTPNAGSFATHTGLRRLYRGNAEVDGQDVDIPFVLKPETVEGEELDELIDRFKEYTELSYPDTEIETTKSSVKLKFTGNINFDLVPMLAVEDENRQIIIRGNGEELETSVRQHVDFIRTRNRLSNDEEGRVKFNECVRLLKWWRDFQSADSYYLGGNDSPPSFLINLLAAHAFDQRGVKKTYAETLFTWSSYLANVVKNHKPILFTDYNNPLEDTYSEWTVMDPVNPENNIVKNWTSQEIDELGDWFSTARDEWSRIIHFNEDEENNKSLDGLVNLFGTPFRNHCDN